MKPIDFVVLIYGLVWIIVTYILLRRNKSKPELWPRILGFGVGMYAFLSFTTGSILILPKSEFLAYTISNFFWSLPAGLIGYVCGRPLYRRYKEYVRKKENKK